MDSVEEIFAPEGWEPIAVRMTVLYLTAERESVNGPE